jgi:hypothetical protein
MDPFGHSEVSRASVADSLSAGRVAKGVTGALMDPLGHSEVSRASVADSLSAGRVVTACAESQSFRESSPRNLVALRRA